MFHDVRTERPQVMSSIQEVGQAGKSRRAVLGQNGSNEFLHQFLRDGSQQQFEIRVADGLAAVGNRLIQQAQGIAHTAFTGTGQGQEASFLQCQLILSCHVLKSLDNFGPGNPAEVVVLAP